MAYSARYRQLASRIEGLRKLFLPVRFSNTGTYNADQLDKARAFRILTHAELEHYFEERVLEIAALSFNLWKTRLKPCASLACLLANVSGDRTSLPKKIGTNTTAITIAGKALAQFNHTVINNNGIRIANLLELLLPIGIDESTIDPVWLSVVDGFGAKRGLAAHTAAVTYQIDPKDELQTVKQIMSGVQDIDLALNAIKKNIR
ncbi:hypothetical protein [Rhodoplanes roseus]|uniref:hypothetical protein n=1 Tax=Rhodoplanes roseus TaxID=29409 RepID=UPI0011B5F2AF|nr:hypothetical protein [Rhodoplanes roseus]